jgi:hypothetical protein
MRQSGWVNSPSSRRERIFRSAIHCHGSGRMPARAPSRAARSPSVSSPSNQDSSAGSWRPVSRGDALSQVGRSVSLESGEIVVVIWAHRNIGALAVDLGEQMAQHRGLLPGFL